MNSNYARVLIPLILVGTFIIDLFMPWGYAVWVVGDVFGVLLALWIEWPIAPYIVAAIATVLACVGHTLSPPGIPVDIAGFNRVVGIALLWITAGLVARTREAKLDDATRRLGAIVESSSDAILSVTPDGFVTTWNAGAERIFGYTATEMIGRSILTLIPVHLHRDRAWLLSTVRGAHDIHTYDAVRLTKGGRCIDVSVTLSPLKDAMGQFVGVSKVIRDISERKQAEILLRQAHEALEIKVQERTAELRSANQALQKLSGRLIQVQEEERSRLARDLHDEVGQLLTALKIDLQDIQHGDVGDSRFSPLTDSLELVDRLLSQVRNLALDLRPSLLDDLGLVSALRWYANRQATRNGWTLSLSVEGMDGRAPAPIEVTCFRVTQEALTNIAKYARAKMIDVTLRREDQEVTLIIQDDGVGFDVPSARQRAQGESIGLLGMEERVRLAGGSFVISSAPGEGTRIELCFPLTEQEQAKPHATVEVISP